MRGVKKEHLPEKICATCGRPFTWRKKWERVWDEVKYCSDACRSHRHSTASAPSPAATPTSRQRTHKR